MSKVSQIGSLLKRLYRNYNNELLNLLQARGFTDLRPSFLEILLFICDNDGPSIKEIGSACGLKKQTMTSHLNELSKRGYIERRANPHDKREQNIFLTEYGERFRFNLFECVSEVESAYTSLVGEVELDRVEHLLSNFHNKVTGSHDDTLQSRIQLNLNLDF